MTRELILIRHTKSPQNVFIPDFERPIKEDRAEDAKTMGKELKSLGLNADKFISSPALRTKQTAELIADELKYGRENIVFDMRLYESSPAEYLKVVHETSEKIKALVLVGHNPSITEFANIFCGNKFDEIPTTGVVWMEFDSEDWRVSDKTKCSVKHSLSPKAI
jgi:phosphohistidine phosphatase